MAKKQDTKTELRTLLEEKKLILGTKVTQKKLQKGSIKKIFLAKNCEDSVKEEFLHYCELFKVECEQLKETNEELGIICKKPFSISVIGVTK